MTRSPDKTSIFTTEAPFYWAAGLPAIPLMYQEKRPAIQRWQMYADTFPTQEERDVWLNTFPDNNIGLPLGPTAGLVAIDIDTDDPKVLRVLDDLLPPTPWTRVGKKGMVRIYRYNGERTTRIKTVDNQMVCEVLSKGTQIVLPPSIHPDTRRPYTANCNLYDVAKACPTLPFGIEDLIRGALKGAGMEVDTGGGQTKITSFVPAGARDNTMVSHAGLLARAVVRGERTLLEALGEMAHWVESYVEQVIGDPLPVEKAQKKVVEFLVRDVTGERPRALPVGWDRGLSSEDKERLGLALTPDDEKWDADRLLNWLAAEFQQHAAGSRDWTRQVHIALQRMARANETVSAVDEEHILRFIAGQSASTVTLRALKQDLARLRRGSVSGENQQEIAKAAAEQIEQFGELKFAAGNFWQWGGAFWQKKSRTDLLKVIQEDFGFYETSKRASDYNGVLKVIETNVASELASVDVRGLNFANGFLTEDMDLVDHSPDHGMTYVLPYRYLPDAAGNMPNFAKYLQDSWGDDSDCTEKVAALQEAMGATLFSHGPTYQRAILLYGAPGSGKSVLMSIMRNLLPNGSVSSVSPNDWSDKFLPAEMYGKVLNVAGELSESRPIPGDIFKQVVVGESIQTQRKNQQPFEFAPRCAQWFSSNHPPRTRDPSGGFNRRWLILEWTRRVPDEKKIVDLDSIIVASEREAIVAWAVDGFVRLRKQGRYTLPGSHSHISDIMAAQNNSVRYFLMECNGILVGPQAAGGSLSFSELFGIWSTFRLGKGGGPVRADRFLMLLREAQEEFGMTVESGTRPGGTMIHGVRAVVPPVGR